MRRGSFDLCQRVSAQPLQRFAFVALVVGFYLWMHKHSERADPMLPFVTGESELGFAVGTGIPAHYRSDALQIPRTFP
jgi:hypothetical protein